MVRSLERGRQKEEGKGKRPKNFVQSKDAALRLAETVADTQEEQSLKRLQRHRQTVQAIATKSHSKMPKKTGSQSRLKEVKATLAAEAARAKREKAKQKKQALKAAKLKPADNRTLKTAGDVDRKPIRKRVAFAD
ncbi:uncharacterized protein LAESUDRAFT_255862 [Laetiporus sulphureus 93-53]|uniref:Uncharacterized protein n=1 Tax=Laetiporus sulphureus 93-53 TaxID=1314785 RepID=A0A165H2X3_9APHY|nr:uncharacterized protein LAESUDRAFT_255862 [Laetiporus sulphureus 93-53]KZT11171.1 hypothetical protein LAESUDRAFT_255862 [Laetiporus sulphureus 93-53]